MLGVPNKTFDMGHLVLVDASILAELLGNRPLGAPKTDQHGWSEREQAT